MMQCKFCKWYEHEPKRMPGAGTGWCKLKRLGSAQRRTHETNWCQDFSQRESVEPSHSVESPGDDHGGELSPGGNARSVSTYEERVEMGRAKAVLRWDDDSEEISVSIYLEGEPHAAAHFTADLCRDRSRRTRPVASRLGSAGITETPIE